MEMAKHIHEFQTSKVNGRENIDLESKDRIYRQKKKKKENDNMERCLLKWVK